MRKRYPLAVLLILLAATALSMALVTTNAAAHPTFEPVCASCHSDATPPGCTPFRHHAGFVHHL